MLKLLSFYSSLFLGYAYLWLEDRETVMQQFLDYSRQLTIDEMEMIAALDPKAPKRLPPRMEQFREQIDLYEGLYLEIEKMNTSQVFCRWFRVDIRPFRQSLLNTVCKWSSMFKRHLVERVTSSLSDLGSFIRYVFLFFFALLIPSLYDPPFTDWRMKAFFNKSTPEITLAS